MAAGANLFTHPLEDFKAARGVAQILLIKQVSILQEKLVFKIVYYVYAVVD